MSLLSPVSNSLKTSNNNINFNTSNSLEKNQTHIEYHPLEFYALGKLNTKNNTDNNNKIKPQPKLTYNYSSHELFNRNLLSVNNSYFDKYKEVKKQADFKANIKNENNYLEPLLSIDIRKQQDIQNQKQNNINSLEWFHIIKNKIYIADNDSRIKKGNNISRNKFYEEKGLPIVDEKNKKSPDKNIINNGYDYHLEKTKPIDSIFNIQRFKQRNENINIPQYKTIDNNNNENNNDYWKKLRIEKNIQNKISVDKFHEKKLKNKNLFFDKNHTSIIRHKNWWQIDENPNKTKISKGAPKWFNIIPQWKSELFNDELIKKQDTITVFSKNQNWLTVTPKKKDRRNALEKKKILDMDATSKLMPRWMEIKGGKKSPDIFKSVEYNNPVKQNPKKMMAFVDKDLNLKKINKVEYNSARSVFNYQDFRHNVVTSNEAKEYGSLVSQKPRRFFDWDDGKRFNPKFKNDV